MSDPAMSDPPPVPDLSSLVDRLPEVTGISGQPFAGVVDRGPAS